MFFSNYLSRRSEMDTLKIDMQRERMEIETEPEEERGELEELLKKEGYTQREVNVMMKRIMANKEMWLRAQLMHELHLHPEDLKGGPVGRATSAGVAFFLFALVSLVPYVLGLTRTSALVPSAALSLTALFILGSKVFTLKHLTLKSGVESVLVGALAAVLLYAFGLALSTV